MTVAQVYRISVPHQVYCISVPHHCSASVYRISVPHQCSASVYRTRCTTSVYRISMTISVFVGRRRTLPVAKRHPPRQSGSQHANTLRCSTPTAQHARPCPPPPMSPEPRMTTESRCPRPPHASLPSECCLQHSTDLSFEESARPTHQSKLLTRHTPRSPMHTHHTPRSPPRTSMCARTHARR